MQCANVVLYRHLWRVRLDSVSQHYIYIYLYNLKKHDFSEKKIIEH